MERMVSLICLCALSAAADMLLGEGGAADCARLLCPLGAVCLLLDWVEEILGLGGG